MKNNFFKNIVTALYYHYKKNHDTSVALFHSKAVVSIVIGLYIYSLYYVLVKFRFLLHYDMSNSDVLIIIFFAIPPFLITHYFSPKLIEIENKPPMNDSDIEKQWFILYSIFGIGACLLIYLVYTYGGLKN